MGFFRILLAIAVLIYHSGTTESYGLHFLNGSTAVFCFFVISGFYMEMILTQKYTKERLGDDYIRRFYLSRFWRLYPTYIVIAGVTLAIWLSSSLIRHPEIPLNHSHHNIASMVRVGFTWFSMIMMLFINVPASKDLLIPPSWTLGVEIAFYALAPFILRARFFWIAVFSIIGIAMQFIPFAQHSPILFGMPYFLLGGFARRYRQIILDKLNHLTPLPILYSAVIAMVFFSMPHNIFLGHPNTHIYNNLDIFIYPILTALLIPVLHERTKLNRIDFWIGQLSYPFYMSHQLVINISDNWHSFPYHVPILITITLLVSLILTILEVRLIEPWRTKFGN